MFKLLLVLYCLAIYAFAATPTYYVSPFGSDSNAGTSTTAPFRTIQRAVQALPSTSSGGTIVLMTGVYSGVGNTQISLYYSTVIQAQPNVIVQCGSTYSPSYAFSARPSAYNINMDISGFTIRNCTIGLQLAAYSNRPYVAIHNMTITDVGTGIDASFINLNVTKVSITSSKYGIQQTGTSSYQNIISVSDSTFFNLTNNAIQALLCFDSFRVNRCNFTRIGDSAIYTKCNTFIDFSTFSYNTASNGSALYTNSSITLQVNNTLFSYNIATGYGGAIAVNSNGAQLAFQNSKFYGNGANYGGGLYTKGVMNVQGLYFGYNKANIAGGGFYCENGQNFVDSTHFDSNIAPTGPASACQGCSSYYSGSVSYTGSGQTTTCK